MGNIHISVRLFTQTQYCLLIFMLTVCSASLLFAESGTEDTSHVTEEPFSPALKKDLPEEAFLAPRRYSFLENVPELDSSTQDHLARGESLEAEPSEQQKTDSEEGDTGSAERVPPEQANPVQTGTAGLYTVEVPEKVRMSASGPSESLNLVRKEKQTILAKKNDILEDQEPDIIMLVMGTVLVVMLIFGSSYLIRKFFPNATFTAQGGAINVIAKKSLSSRQTLLLVEVGRKTFLLATTKDTVVSLGDFSDQDSVSTMKAMSTAAEEGSSVSDFQTQLNQTLSTGENDEGVDPEEKARLDNLFGEVESIRQKVKGWRGSFD